MKTLIQAICIATIATASAFADDRQVIKVPSEIKAMFLEEMRSHLDNLNEITLAIASGDFKGAAYVAETKMTFGHGMRTLMLDQGLTPEQIDAIMESMRQQNGGTMGRGKGMGKGMGGGGQGMGMGRYMPDEVRQLGQTFHEAAANFAKVAKSVSSPATAEDYQNVFNALSETIDVCSACHSSYRVE